MKRTITGPWKTSAFKDGHRKRRLLARETEKEQSEKQEENWKAVWTKNY